MYNVSLYHPASISAEYCLYVSRKVSAREAALNFLSNCPLSLLKNNTVVFVWNDAEPSKLYRFTYKVKAVLDDDCDTTDIKLELLFNTIKQRLIEAREDDCTDIVEKAMEYVDGSLTHDQFQDCVNDAKGQQDDLSKIRSAKSFADLLEFMHKDYIFAVAAPGDLVELQKILT